MIILEGEGMEETTVQVQFIDGKNYSRVDKKDFVAGEHYRLPNGKLYYCFTDGPKGVFLSFFDNIAPMHILGNRQMEVFDLEVVL